MLTFPSCETPESVATEGIIIERTDALLGVTITTDDCFSIPSCRSSRMTLAGDAVSASRSRRSFTGVDKSLAESVNFSLTDVVTTDVSTGDKAGPSNITSATVPLIDTKESASEAVDPWVGCEGKDWVGRISRRKSRGLLEEK